MAQMVRAPGCGPGGRGFKSHRPPQLLFVSRSYSQDFPVVPFSALVPIMNILFCCEGFIVDGVTSYNLYMSSALQSVGHTVAVLGRWGGFKGFQKRHKQHGVTVLQDLSPTVSSSRLLKMGVRFKPDLIITDSRRAFPLSQKLKKLTSAKVVTVFHDPPQKERKGARSIGSLIQGSDYWLTSEKPILEELEKIQTDLPKHFLQRPITNMVNPAPLGGSDPFSVLCLGRLSRWKSPGMKYLVDHADRLLEQIPSLQLNIVGGGGKLIQFRLAARRTNRRIGRKVVNILGTQVDPNPWYNQATVVCAGATSAIEAILSNRPVIAFSGVWMGPVTEDNLEYGAKTHFGERDGKIYTAMNPNLIYLEDQPQMLMDSLIDLYTHWDEACMQNRVTSLRKRLFSRFDSQKIANNFTRLIA